MSDGRITDLDRQIAGDKRHPCSQTMKRLIICEKALRRIATRDVAAKRPEARAWDYEQVAAEALAK